MTIARKVPIMGRGLTAAQQKAAEVYDALVEMQARPTTSNDDATTLIEAATIVAAVRDGRMTAPARVSSATDGAT